MNKPILEINNLTVIYKNNQEAVKALDNISFSLASREILGIVGESASGKSTLALAILNLFNSQVELSGRIIFNQEDILGLSDQQLNKLRGNQIGLIFQEAASSLNPLLTIGYQFHEVLKEKSGINDQALRNKIVLEKLGQVKLTRAQDLLYCYPHQLSGGQLQRIVIAMAIALKPKLLIADEPTSSLDVTTQSQIIYLFKELRDELDLPIIFITHNLDLVKTICQRVIVLYRGQIREITDTNLLFVNPQDSYTKTLIDSFMAIEG